MSYLVCDSTKCIPKWDDFTFNLKIEPGESRQEFKGNIDLEYPKYNSEVNKMMTDDADFNKALQGGLFSFILFAMGMGFLALLTPCVFPMIPITVSFFTKHGEDNDSNPIFAALIYTLGIIVIFTSLGLNLSYDERLAANYMKSENIEINIETFTGKKNFTAYTMDLTK